MKLLKQYSLLFLGCILFSVYASVFLAPAKIGTGGLLGISLCLNKLFNLKIGLSTLLMNIPLFLFGFKLLGKNFAFKSGLIVVISSFLIDYIPVFIHITPLSDKLTAAIFCGVISGVGMSLIFMAGGSTGGLDISGKITKNFFQTLPLSKILLCQDILVYIFVGIVLGPHSVMYALIMSFIRSKTIDAIQEGIASSKQCVIICADDKRMIEEINTKLGRGVTVLNALGGYSHTNKKFVYVVIQRNELSPLKDIVKRVEPSAFVTVSQVNDIFGNYKQHSLSV